MTSQLNIFGEIYEDTEPCFFTIASGIKVYSRLTREWFDWDALAAKAASEGHTWSHREVGIPSQKWQLANTRMNGWYFAPGLDNTQGLASEAITNGEVWTGATGVIPPDGWTVSEGTPDFTTDGEWLNVTNASGTGAFSQTISGLTPGAYYIAEIVIGGNITTSNTYANFNDIQIQIGPWDGTGYDLGTAIRCLSFQAPPSGSFDLSFSIVGAGSMQLRFARIFLESELTGSGGIVLMPESQPVPNPVKGPFMAFGKEFWINTDTKKIGFDVDSDPEPELWVTGLNICDAQGIEDRVKLAINAQLEALGLPSLPCMTKSGNLKKAFAQSEE